jgi:CubicO group peptidase (beta-lactamase class C family)
MMNAILRRLIAATSVAAALATVATSAQQPPVFTPYGAIPVLEAYLEPLRQQAGIPGMSAALVYDGQIVWEKGYGFQNLTTRVRATPDTPYVIGDMSSTIAAALLLQCVEIRRLSLDDPLRRYGLTLPEPDVTLRQLLSHTASDPAAEPFNYSIERFAQLTGVMEWCAPQPYRKSVSHRILNRLAMKDSVPGTDFVNPDLPMPEGLYQPEELARYRGVLARLAVPYKVDGRGRAERSDLPPTVVTAGGGIVSTVRDLARFEAALDDGVLLLDETRELAWNPVMTARGAQMPTGLGWFVQAHRGERIVWHFGHVPYAYSSLVVKVPSRRLTFILLANSDGLSAPFQLQSGNITRSLFATLFLRLAT